MKKIRKVSGVVPLSSCVLFAIGIFAVADCRRQPESEWTKVPGIAERTGAALDHAADRIAETGPGFGEAAEDHTGRAIKRSGGAMENAGESVARH